MADENTTLRLRTQGQKLILVHDAPLASGAINATHVQIEFDTSWDEFTNKTVHFYKSWTTKSAIMPIDSNIVEIPADILKYYEDVETGHWDEDCWINVSGIGQHKTITTNRLKTKIALGGLGDAYEDPSPSLYELLINAIEGGGMVAVRSVNGMTGDVFLTTDEISEGYTNKYFSKDWQDKVEALMDSINLNVVVPTKMKLDQVKTEGLEDGNYAHVSSDESHGGNPSYYRLNKDAYSSTWEFIDKPVAIKNMLGINYTAGDGIKIENNVISLDLENLDGRHF